MKGKKQMSNKPKEAVIGLKISRDVLTEKSEDEISARLITVLMKMVREYIQDAQGETKTEKIYGPLDVFGGSVLVSFDERREQ